MITLLFVTLPIEIIFVTVVRALGWLRLSFLFLVLSVMFFFIAVSLPLFSGIGLIWLIGAHISRHSSVSDPLSVVEKLRPRRVRASYPLCADGSRGTAIAGDMFRDCHPGY